MNPLQAPKWGPLWRELPVSRAFFYMSLKFLNKSSSDKKNLTLFLKALGKEHPPMFPKTGTLWKQTPISRAILYISFRVPSKGAPPLQVPLIELPQTERERDAPFP